MRFDSRRVQWATTNITKVSPPPGPQSSTTPWYSIIPTTVYPRASYKRASATVRSSSPRRTSQWLVHTLADFAAGTQWTRLHQHFRPLSLTSPSQLYHQCRLLVWTVVWSLAGIES